MIYIKDERMYYLHPDKFEYDITGLHRRTYRRARETKKEIIPMGYIDYSIEPQSDIAFPRYEVLLRFCRMCG